MNSKRGFFNMPSVNPGLHFDGIRALSRLNLGPQVARKMLLKAYKWTGEEALWDRIVDEIVAPETMEEHAIEGGQGACGEGDDGRVRAAEE